MALTEEQHWSTHHPPPLTSVANHGLVLNTRHNRCSLNYNIPRLCFQLQQTYSKSWVIQASPSHFCATLVTKLIPSFSTNSRNCTTDKMINGKNLCCNPKNYHELSSSLSPPLLSIKSRCRTVQISILCDPFYYL